MIKNGIVELHELLDNGSVTCSDLVNESIKEAHNLQNNCNAFVTIIDDAKNDCKSDSILCGIPFGVKDNYSTKGVLSTGSSNTLKDYVPFFDATAVENLKKCGAVMIAKTALDEFGMGGTGTTAHTGVIKNPWDKKRICGGSSAGSACSVAAGVYPFAFGSDTGDSIRKPAAYCGVVGYKPTYGMISRYGLFAFASSLDTCGVFTRNVRDAAIVVDAMKGIDDKDQTTWDSSDIKLYENLNNKVDGKKLFYISELVDINNYSNPSDELKKHLEEFHKLILVCKNMGMKVEGVSIDKTLLDAIPSVYVCISCAEATSNMSNLTGLIFGPRGNGVNVVDMMKDYRTKGFSPLIKRRFVIGSYVLQKENQERYYLNACRVRRLIVDKFKSLFKEYDGCIMPVGSGVAPLISEANNTITDNDVNVLENHLQIANFGGFPSITIPSGFINNLPVGLNITGDCYKDQEVLNIAYAIEEKLDYKNVIARDYNE